MNDVGDRKLAILAAHEFFRDVPQPILARLAARARGVTYAAGQTIFLKGDEGHGLLAVLEGSVKISVLSEDGREIALNMIGANEVFGEIALLDGLPRTADATALTPCRLLVLDRRDFVPILLEEPTVGLRLLQVVSRRLRRTSEQVEDLIFESISTRLAKALMRLAEVQGTAQLAQPRVTITQKELGRSIGISRESTNKKLREWETAGLLSVEKGGCRILNPHALRSQREDDWDA